MDKTERQTPGGKDSLGDMERRFLLGTDAVMSVYFQIPFCKTLCRFCCWTLDYSKRHVLGLGRYRDAYLSALKREIRMRSRIKEERDRLDLKVIHFGGGTPSILTAAQLEDILTTFYTCNDITPGSVDTLSIEVRPDSVTPDKLKDLRSAGFNRISIGAQTFDSGVLKKTGRNLSPEAFFRCYEAARASGFDNINVDLLFGLPGQTMDMVQRDINILVELSPEHIETSPWKPVVKEGGGSHAGPGVVKRAEDFGSPIPPADSPGKRVRQLRPQMLCKAARI